MSQDVGPPQLPIIRRGNRLVPAGSIAIIPQVLMLGVFRRHCGGLKPASYDAPLLANDSHIGHGWLLVALDQEFTNLLGSVGRPDLFPGNSIAGLADLVLQCCRKHWGI